MAKWGECDYSELEEFAKKLEKLADETDEFCEECAKELAARLLSYVIPETPTGEIPDYVERDVKITIEDSDDKPIYELAKITDKKKYIRRRHRKTYMMYTAAGAYWNGYVGGTLKRGWISQTASEAENGSGNPTAADGIEYAERLKVEKNGNEYSIAVTNAIPYASYVEFGHRQRPGRFVRAIGRRLKNAWSPGKFFLTRSEERLERTKKKILNDKLEKKLKEVFGDG